MSERIEMRRSLRARRAALSSSQRLRFAQRIASHVATTRWLQGGRAIGLYLSIGYEVATGPLLTLAQRRHCPVYLPRIVDYRQHRMVFAPQSRAAWSHNRYGIPEPSGHKLVSVHALSVVFMPLLGFDAAGTRLGSGAGYYDRLFLFRRHRLIWQRPLLVGIAYRCQQLPRIPRSAHDVPLDALVSEQGVTYFSDGDRKHEPLASQD